MIRVVRNIGVRLWVAVLLAVPAGFWLLPVMGRLAPGMPPFAWILTLVAVLFLLTGMVFDVMAKLLIGALIREGEMWERAGILPKARKKYNRAVRALDTFLLSPFSIQSVSEKITGALARFHLTAGENGNKVFRRATARYLLRHTRDQALASLWLNRLVRIRDITQREQEVLTRLAEGPETASAHLTELVEIFLLLDRVDYTAQTLYTRAMADGGLTRKFGDRIRRLTGLSPGTWPVDNVLSDYRPPFAAPDGKLEMSSAGRQTPGRSALLMILARLKKSATGWVTGGREWLGVGASGIRETGRLVAVAASRLRQRERAGFYLKMAAMGFLSLWLVFFVWNTISHLTAPKPPSPVIPAPEEPVVEIVPKPFTIQVAAYLKQSHADRYISLLAKKGVAAKIKKTRGGGKTWYLIRVSEFEDRETAQYFGNKLVSQNIIEEFFVSNKD